MVIYLPFALLGLFITIVLFFLYVMQKKDDHKMRSLLQQMRLENKTDSKEARQILIGIERNFEEIQKTNSELKQMNKDNSIYLRMIFERVDKSGSET